MVKIWKSLLNLPLLAVFYCGAFLSISLLLFIIQLGSGSSGHSSPRHLNGMGGGGHHTLLLTEQPPKKKGGDDKLYSSNEEELGKILSCSGTDSDNRDTLKKSNHGKNSSDKGSDEFS